MKFHNQNREEPVILNEAKNLGGGMHRFFASLRMTGRGSLTLPVLIVKLQYRR